MVTESCGKGKSSLIMISKDYLLKLPESSTVTSIISASCKCVSSTITSTLSIPGKCVRLTASIISNTVSLPRKCVRSTASVISNTASLPVKCLREIRSQTLLVWHYIQDAEEILRRRNAEGHILQREWNEMLSCQDIETVDQSTVHGDLHVSEDNKMISFQPACPGERVEWPCALAKKLASGKHCWILEVGEKSSWAVGVASETILKNLSIPEFCEEGYWYIKLFKGKKFQAFSSSITDLSQKPRKIAVYLDFDKSELLFVDMETQMTIHKFKQQFSEKLYPVFSPGIHDKGPLILQSISQKVSSSLHPQHDVKETLGKLTSLLLQLPFVALLLQPQNDVKEILGKFTSLLLQLPFDVKKILGKFIFLLRQWPNEVEEILRRWNPEGFVLETEWNEMLTSQDIEEVDPRTTHGDLHVSEDNKRISFQENVKCPGGRAEWPCALAKMLTSGKHCWILEVGEKSSWAVGVTSESVSSIPDSCKEGYWYIKLFKGKKFQAFSSSVTDLGKKPKKIAVYLNFDKGELSFVDVEERVIIHRFKEQFSEKLYPVFSPGIHDKGPLIMQPVCQKDVKETLRRFTSLLLQLPFEVEEILRRWYPEGFVLETEWNEMLTSQDIEEVDPRTTHGDLHVSEDNKRISFQENVKCPGGRAEWPCALAKMLTSGKHCWILEVGEKSSWAVGVTSESVSSIPDSCKEGYWYIKLFKGKKFQAFSSSVTDLGKNPKKSQCI
ncbi:uncharacterized protein LOC120525127 isoform X1 [Polypterus senegalus]|uniref:uncharacterized protein LOC120525127 isoform X1 n=1 Tax=Polypterus senegalus TaxID=55291 RepID=UPI00196244AC|nr:uncharacterized protein LOC120525127 isoform X1 [Polypterus senegalus]